MKTPQDYQQEIAALTEQYEKDHAAILAHAPMETREQLGDPLKKVLGLKEFTANKQLYIVRRSLSVARFEAFERLQVEVGFGVDFGNLYANVAKVYDYINTVKLADASVACRNVLDGVKTNLQDRENLMLKLCALFICRPGEDISTYDEILAAQKIDDWRKEGIEMNTLFTYALNLVNGFTVVYKEASQDISALRNEVKKGNKKTK